MSYWISKQSLSNERDIKTHFESFLFATYSYLVSPKRIGQFGSANHLHAFDLLSSFQVYMKETFKSSS